jgi:hypothetical protein
VQSRSFYKQAIEHIGELIVSLYQQNSHTESLHASVMKSAAKPWDELAFRQATLEQNQQRKSEIHGWSQDPYDPAINAPLMRNLAENEHYDAQFPHHPLSRLRSVLRQLQPSLRLAPELKELPPFVYPPATPALATSRQDKKPWWKPW